MTVETERLGHARQIIMHLTPAEVSSYDGIVAVRHTVRVSPGMSAEASSIIASHISSGWQQ